MSAHILDHHDFDSIADKISYGEKVDYEDKCMYKKLKYLHEGTFDQMQRFTKHDFKLMVKISYLARNIRLDLRGSGDSYHSLFVTLTLILCQKINSMVIASEYIIYTLNMVQT